MKTLKYWSLNASDKNSIELRVDNRHLLCLSVLEQALIRVTLKRHGQFALDRT